MSHPCMWRPRVLDQNFWCCCCCCCLPLVGASCWCLLLLLLLLLFVCCVCGGCSRFLGLSPGPPSAGPPFSAQNFALFFLSPAGNFILSCLSGGSMTPTETRILGGPWPCKAATIPREDPPEREERMKFPAGERKKSAKFWAPPPFGPPPFGPHPSAPTPSGPHPFGPPLFHPFGPTPSGPHPWPTPKTKNWPNAVWPKSVNKNCQIRPNKVGQMRPVNFGQMWYWPNSVWPIAAK